MKGCSLSVQTYRTAPCWQGSGRLQSGKDRVQLSVLRRDKWGEAIPARECCSSHRDVYRAVMVFTKGCYGIYRGVVVAMLLVILGGGTVPPENLEVSERKR